MNIVNNPVEAVSNLYRSATRSNVQHLIERYVLLSDRPDEAEQEFRDYIHDLASQLIYAVLVIAAVFVLISWPTDYVFFDRAEIHQFYVRWRSFTLMAIATVLIAYHVSDYVERHFVGIVLSALLIENFATAYFIGEITSPSEPWFHVIYVTAFYSVFLPADLGVRSAVTITLPLSWAVGFAGLRPEYYDYPYYGFVGIIALCVISISIMLGHAVFAAFRENYFRNKELSKAQQELQDEQEKTENLLLNILPETVADRLKHGEDVAENFENVTVLFADIVKFTPLAQKLPPDEVVSMLDDIFSEFDGLVAEHGVEKIKTIGDEYFAAAGIPEPVDDHALRMAELACSMQEAITQYERKEGVPFKLRIGLNSGTVMAGVIGERKFVYDLWGDTVNIGSRMESQGEPGQIQVTPETKRLIEQQASSDRFQFEERPPLTIKGAGEMTPYFLYRTDRISETGSRSNSPLTTPATVRS